MDYPHQIDCVWLATDSMGQLAAIITAGEGPIPESVLAHDFDMMDIERALLDLPVIGEARLIEQIPDPSSFLALSLRGLFVYDWTDLHRLSAEAVRAYELVSVPSVQASLQTLPAELRGVACEVDAVFGSPFVTVG